MSACFSYGLAAGEEIKQITIRHGTAQLWQGLPVLVIVLMGGFTTNAVWCAVLSVRNRTWREYFDANASGAPVDRDGELILETAIDAPGEEMARAVAVQERTAGQNTDACQLSV